MADDLPVHPGLLLNDVVVPALAAAGVNKTAFAEHLGMTTENLRQLLAGRRALSAEAAARLGALIGRGDAWACQQARYDLAVAARKLDNALGSLPDLSIVRLALAA